MIIVLKILSEIQMQIGFSNSFYGFGFPFEVTQKLLHWHLIQHIRI